MAPIRPPHYAVNPVAPQDRIVCAAGPSAPSNDLPPYVIQNLNAQVAACLDRTLPQILPAAFATAVADLDTKLLIVIAKSANTQLDDGVAIPYEEVPFPNGIMPTEVAPSPFPLLGTSADVAALDGPQSKAYFTGYYPGVKVPHLIKDRKKGIRMAIGCMKEN